MTNQAPSPSGSEQNQSMRRRFLKVFFIGSASLAAGALAYRVGQWSRFTQQSLLEANATLSSPTAPPALLQLPPLTGTSMSRNNPDLLNKVTAWPTIDPSSGDAQLPLISPTTTNTSVLASQGIAKPPVITQREWGGLQPTRGFRSQQPNRITLHHEGVIFDGSISAAAYLRRVQIWSMNNRGWPDLPYHFIVDLQGSIYEGRPLTTRGDTNTSYDTQDHAQIALLGKYDEGEQQPNSVQIATIIALMAWIVSTYNIDLDKIKGHRDFIPINGEGKHIDPRTGERITCPGDNLYRYLVDGTIQRGIKIALEKNEPVPMPTEFIQKQKL
ncbi:N-acetylmuramoyl-L-alanine amidase [Candidatus Chloroploca sp. M-50]|uniref:N-acetylmuramoyl-L-alanine amidase n=1 Tax=Candidatus Chloroploca mongolica TaxID=2528176 RepID=A0ABS4D4T8_9CHLR|nr:peptidoglycan recognition family protein [Candidatus Chloroploca mongolica]MBP1464439.1 N-acetylmuramoyl-L-alanine amidase [Candidatus Chloroploca mongolica]